MLLAAGVAVVAAVEPAKAAFPGTNGKIAYTMGGDIWTMKPDGSEQVKLTDTTAGDAFEPQWSANGRKILFNYCSGPDPEFCTGEIHRMNADGSGEVTLTATHDFEPSWFPTGNRIVFTHWGGRPEGFGIYAMTFDASGETTRVTLLTNDGQCPVISPDGTKIAFLSPRDGEGMGLWVMRAAPEGSANQPVKLAGGMPWGGCGSNPTHDWAPDGKRIAYTPLRRTPDGVAKPSNIWVMNADGTANTNLTKTPDVSETSPAFSPNGKKIVFQGYEDGRTGIWKMGAEGSNPTLIMDSMDSSGLSPDWQPLP